MGDFIQLAPGENDLGRIVAALREVINRLPATEAGAAAATPTSTQIISGGGLTGGGDLSSDRTLAVGAGTGITVNADDVALTNMAQSTIKGRAVGAGTGAPTDLTATQATAILDVFTSGAKGLVPASGGGTTNFLRADGSFASASFTAASAADQETATSNTVAVTPLFQQRHPSACKAWVRFNSAGTISSGGSYNVTSVTDGGASSMTVNFTTAFSSATAYGISAVCGDVSTDFALGVVLTAAPAAASCRFGNRRWFDGASVDPDTPDVWSASFFGDQ